MVLSIVIFLYKFIRHFVFVFVLFCFVLFCFLGGFLNTNLLQIPYLLIYLIMLLYLAEMPVYMSEENRKHQQQQELHNYKSGDRIRSQVQDTMEKLSLVQHVLHHTQPELRLLNNPEELRQTLPINTSGKAFVTYK